MDTPPQKPLGFQLKPEIAKGTYSNLAIISHSHSEFILDFATMLPGFAQPEIGSRIIMTPEHAKRLMNALFDNISKYEGQFGVIHTSSQPGGDAPLNFSDFDPFGDGGNHTKS